MAHEYEWKVFAEHTDAAGVIYTPEVIACMCRAMETLLEEIGHSIRDNNEEKGFGTFAVKTQATFLNPFSWGDVVTVSIVPEMGDTSITFVGKGTVDGEPVFESELTVVVVSHETFEPMPIPDDMREALAPYAA